MRLLQSLHLRQKFLLIMGIAFLLPLFFYTGFMGLCLLSIGEIERRSMSDEILETEHLVRLLMGHLERAAQFIRTQTGTEYGNGEGDRFSSQSQFVSDWLKKVSRLEFAVLHQGGQFNPLFIRKVRSENEPLSHSIMETFRNLDKSTSGSGFIKIHGKTYLVHLSPDTDPLSGVDILLGMDLEKEMLPPVSQGSQGRFVITEIPKEEVPVRQESIWETNDNKGSITMHRSLPGLVPGSLFDLQYTSQIALFDQLRTRLVWFPTFFLGTILISSLIGAAWATTLVLWPLKRMSTTMALVSGPGDYITRIPEDTGDEIGDLAASFNRLMARLEEAQKDLESAQKAQVEAEKLATHEINNPLAALVGQAELQLLDSKTPTKMKKSLEVIHDMGLRIAEVIKKLQRVDTVHTTTYLRNQNMVQINILEPEEQKVEVPGWKDANQTEKVIGVSQM